MAFVGFSAVFVVALVIGRGPFATVEENPLSPTFPGNESGGFLTGLVHPPSTDAAIELADSGPGSDREGRREPAVASHVFTPAAQAGVARYLARKYHLSADAMTLMVKEADTTGQAAGIDPLLLLAVIGVESGFNPFAESGVGAQGLMQVMSKIHRDKLEEFGGARAALDPVANIKIGAFILKDCIRRGGSVRDGLRLYVGSTTEDDGGYGAHVLQEKDRIQLAARGGNPLIIPVSVQAPKVAATPAKTAESRDDPVPSADATPTTRARDKMAAAL